MRTSSGITGSELEDASRSAGASSRRTCVAHAARGVLSRSSSTEAKRLRRGAAVSRATRSRGRRRRRRSRRIGQAGREDEADVHVQEMQYEDQQADIEARVQQGGGDSEMRRLPQQSPYCR